MNESRKAELDHAVSELDGMMQTGFIKEADYLKVYHLVVKVLKDSRFAEREIIYILTESMYDLMKHLILIAFRIEDSIDKLSNDPLKSSEELSVRYTIFRLLGGMD